MANKKSRHDAACYYAGKLMGRCTMADSEACVQFMKSCHGDAALVLQAYTCFSENLKSILEKIVAVQVAERRKEGIYIAPEDSPWGEVQTCRELCSGVFMVSTASHGGIMVVKETITTLSASARKCGFLEGGYLCFEEDSQAGVVLRELLDKTPAVVPDYVTDVQSFEACINCSLQEYNPAYWKSRKRRLSKERDGTHGIQTSLLADSKCL